MIKHIKFPSIDHFSNAVKSITMQTHYAGKDENGKAIYDISKPLPKIKFTGTVKLHGTNASVCFNPSTNEYWAQSRENVITPAKDNAGFAQFAEAKKQVFLDLFEEIIFNHNVNHKSITNETITIYGEWAGKGIHSGVAISELPEKHFFVFGVKVSPDNETVEDEDVASYWIDHSYVIATEHRIFNTNDFQKFEAEVDFNFPKIALNTLVSITEQVEQECPVGKHFGFTGIGEGVVYSAEYNGTVIRFKVKGEKHSKSKVKTIKPVDDVKENLKITIATEVLPSWRLEQALENVCNTLNGGKPDIRQLGDFIKWVSNDIIKEDLSKISGAGLEVKEVFPYTSKMAKMFFFDAINESLNLK